MFLVFEYWAPRTIFWTRIVFGIFLLVFLDIITFWFSGNKLFCVKIHHQQPQEIRIYYLWLVLLFYSLWFFLPMFRILSGLGSTYYALNHFANYYFLAIWTNMNSLWYVMESSKHLEFLVVTAVTCSASFFGGQIFV